VRDKEIQQRRKKKKRFLDLDAHIVKRQDQEFQPNTVNNPEFNASHSILWHWEICKEGQIKQCRIIYRKKNSLLALKNEKKRKKFQA
jgi:hypothetical protein